MAQENTRIQHQNLAKLKRKQEIEKARLIREQERERERHEKQRQYIALLAQKGVEPFIVPNRASQLLSKPPVKPSPPSKVLSISKGALNTKGPQAIKQPSSQPTMLGSSLTKPSKNPPEPRLNSRVKDRTAAFLSFDELKKIANSETQTPKSKVPSHQDSVNTIKPIPVQKISSHLHENKSQQKERLNKNALGSPTSFKRSIAGNKSQPSNRLIVAQDALKQQASASLPPKRPLPVEQKSSLPGLVGSRFAKYGPIDSEPPSKILKPGNDSMPSHKPQVMHQSLKSSSMPESLGRKNKVVTSEKLKQSSKTFEHPPKKVQPSESSLNPLRPISKPTRHTRTPSPPLPRKRIEERPRRPFDPRDDILDEDYAKKNISSIIGSIFGYDRSKYRDEDSDDDMVVSASRVRAEELRSARLGREEDEREEALERQRLLRLRQRKNKR